MPRPRYRIRYRKVDDLRFVGHQDLVRTWDRVLRRADVKAAMSEGFHPRPRLNFPSALAVGIAGVDEVLELELIDPIEPAELTAILSAHLPPGLSIASVEPIGDATRFSQPATARYELPLPQERVAAVRERIAAWQSAESAAERLPDTVMAIDVVDDVLQMDLRLGEAGAVRPRDVLFRLEAADVEASGATLTRTRVEVRTTLPPPAPQRKPNISDQEDSPSDSLADATVGPVAAEASAQTDSNVGNN